MQLCERVENSALSVSLLLINSCYEFLYFKFIDLISLIYFLYNGIKKKKKIFFYCDCILFRVIWTLQTCIICTSLAPRPLQPIIFRSIWGHFNLWIIDMISSNGSFRAIIEYYVHVSANCTCLNSTYEKSLGNY